MHPDHIGMAGWMTRRYDCRLWMTRLEYLNCRMLVADTGREAPDDGVRFYRRAGWNEDEIEAYRARAVFKRRHHAYTNNGLQELAKQASVEWQNAYQECAAGAAGEAAPDDEQP